MSSESELQSALEQIQVLRAQAGGLKTNADETLGTRLRNIREREVLTRRDVAHQAGVHPATIARIERGQAYPRPETTHRLAHPYSAIVSSSPDTTASEARS
jgi:DNA-binding XRE family transcriptional regulator